MTRWPQDCRCWFLNHDLWHERWIPQSALKVLKGYGQRAKADSILSWTCRPQTIIIIIIITTQHQSISPSPHQSLIRSTIQSLSMAQPEAEMDSFRRRTVHVPPIILLRRSDWQRTIIRQLRRHDAYRLCRSHVMPMARLTHGHPSCATCSICSRVSPVRDGLWIVDCGSTLHPSHWSTQYDAMAVRRSMREMVCTAVSVRTSCPPAAAVRGLHDRYQRCGEGKRSRLKGTGTRYDSTMPRSRW